MNNIKMYINMNFITDGMDNEIDNDDTDVQMIDTTYVEQMSSDKGMILSNCF